MTRWESCGLAWLKTWWPAVAIGACGCALSVPILETETITVMGVATVRGNVPFTTVMLETEERNLYVLVLDDEQRAALDRTLPARLRVTGELYRGEWHGRPIAHLRCQALQRME